MKHLFTLLIMACVFGGGIQLHAQNAIPASGGEASGSGGTSSYTIGQIVYTAESATGGAITQGVQQHYEISAVTGIEKAKGITLSFSAYPNPTTDYITLEVKDFEISILYFQLFDMQGKLLQNEKITGNQTSIVMSNLAPATYFVKVTQQNKELKTFKIIKK